MSERAELIRYFKAFRFDNEMPFDRALLPRRFDNVSELDEGYAANERAAERAMKADSKPGELAALRVRVSKLESLVKMIDADAVKALKIVGERLEMLEAKPAIIDRGVWKAGSNYRAGSFVTKAGSGWIAQNDSPGIPGEDHAGWRLSVKRGRDGKDAKVTK